MWLGLEHCTRQMLSFEHSLVDELRYNGFHRMRILFDHAMLQEGTKNKYDKKMFPLVVDAGCGTGLAGEVVSMNVTLSNITPSLPFK